jgi:hypothetical protein
MVPVWILIVGIIAIVLGGLWQTRNYINGLLGYDVGFSVAGTMVDTVRIGRPVVWWYVDDGEVNSRQWLDWGNRATRQPNEPYLQVCLARANALWSGAFDVRPLFGREAAVAQLVGVPEGWERCPPELWLQYCRAALLAQRGGLWLDGSVLPVGSAEDLKARLVGRDVLMFGADPAENIVGPKQGGPAAGSSAGWAAKPQHPMWKGLAADWGSIIAEGAAAWSAPRARRAERWLWDKHCATQTYVDRRGEVSRDRYGKRLELDTLLGATAWPTGSLEGGLWVPLPDGRTGLERATNWAWFCRLSPEQIAESEFLWAQWSAGK